MARIFVFYQYFYPDPNVSSVHFSELCASLAALGWDVTAFPSNRNVESTGIAYPRSSAWQAVNIRRLWRPRLGRGSSAGRLLNAAWMILRWSLLALRPQRAPDVLLVGTDPILSVFIAPVWRLLHPHTRIVHWCFDLYPEAAYADGLISRTGLLARILTALLRPSYRSCALIVDIGSCMRQLLLHYGSSWKTATLVPWALSEPPLPLPTPPAERSAIFGAAKLALMYSGTFGRAHSSEDMLDLMRHLEGDSAFLALSVKGQRELALHSAAASHPNVGFVPFASKDRLEERLAAADIHIVSLREEWTGTVVPSKFFGALAVGRPILFCGSRHSSIARWIDEFGLGWVLSSGTAREVAQALRSCIGDEAAMQQMRARCHTVYREHFSRNATTTGWHRELSALLAAVAVPPVSAP